MAAIDQFTSVLQKLDAERRQDLYLCQGESEDCEKLHHLLVEPHSRYQFVRHDHALVEFLDYHVNGFRLCELEHLQRILQALLESAEQHPQNNCHITLILKLYGKGTFWKQRMQDEITFLPPAANLLSYLGTLLLSNDTTLKTRIIETLLKLCISISGEGKAEIEEPVDERWKRVAPHFITKCFERSTVCEPLLQILTDEKLSLDAVVDGLMILKRLEKLSYGNCEKVLNYNGVEVICGLLNVPGDEYEVHRIKFWCLEVLGLLIRVIGEKAVARLSNKESVQRIRDGLFNILHQCNDRRLRHLSEASCSCLRKPVTGSSSRGLRNETAPLCSAQRQQCQPHQKSSRNDFLNLICILVKSNPHLPYHMPGFAKELILLATYPEVKHPDPLFVNQSLAQVPEDYEMKQLLYVIVLLMSTASEIKQVVDPPKLLEALILYLYPVITCADDFKAKLCPITYKRKLQEVALQALAVFAPTFLTAYLEGRGNVRILEQINWCYVKGYLKSELLSYERDFYVKALLHILMRVIETQDQRVLEELSILAAVPLLINILKETIEVPLRAPPIDSVLEIEVSAFIILAALCDAKDEFKVESERYCIAECLDKWHIAYVTLPLLSEYKESHCSSLLHRAVAGGVVSVYNFQVAWCVEDLSEPLKQFGVYKIGAKKFCTQLNGRRSRLKGLRAELSTDVETVWIGTGGLALIIKFLRLMTKEEAVLLPKYNLLLASCINFIWCTVVGVIPVEKKFKELEGMFLLLEILNLVHPSMQSMLLACMMDLCENLNLVESSLEWRGPNNMTSPQLFCRIWREEETRIGSLRDEKQKITDIEIPLMGHHQANCEILSHPSLELSPAVLDVSENFRVNIYGLVERMKETGNQSLNGSLHPVELMKLSLENMLTLAVIEGYLDLKGSEVWNEVLVELEDDDLQPLLSDQEFVNTVVRVNHTRGQSALSFQEQFSNLSHGEKMQEEKLLYHQMHMWRDQKMLTLERIYTFLAATTDYAVLRSIKEREQLMINLKRTANTMRRLEDEKSYYVAKKQLRP